MDLATSQINCSKRYLTIVVNMPSTFFFIAGTLLLSLNFVRPFGLAISDWLYFIAIGSALLETIYYDKKNRSPWIKNRFLWFAFLILIGGVISLENSKNIKVAVFEIIQQLYVITLFISLIWIMVKRGQTKNILLAFISSGVFTACIAVTDYLTGTRYGPILSGTPDINWWGRYAGTLGHANKFGYFLVLTVLLTFGYWLGSVYKQKRKTLFNVFWVCIFLIQIFGIYLSNSVTAYVGLMVGVLIYGYAILLKKGYIKKKSWAYPTLLLISSSIILIFTLPYLKTSNAIYFVQKALERVATTTSETRVVVYKLAWERILRNPLIGVGNDQISTSGIRFISSALTLDVHNALLQIWYTGGLFAFAGWLAIYIYFGWSAIKILIGKTTQSPLIIGISVAVLSVLVMDQFQDAIYQREKWLVFGLLVSYSWEQVRINKSIYEKNRRYHVVISDQVTT